MRSAGRADAPRATDAGKPGETPADLEGIEVRETDNPLIWNEFGIDFKNGTGKRVFYRKPKTIYG